MGVCYGPASQSTWATNCTETQHWGTRCRRASTSRYRYMGRLSGYTQTWRAFRCHQNHSHFFRITQIFSQQFEWNSDVLTFKFRLFFYRILMQNFFIQVLFWERYLFKFVLYIHIFPDIHYDLCQDIIAGLHTSGMKYWILFLTVNLQADFPTSARFSIFILTRLEIHVNYVDFWFQRCFRNILLITSWLFIVWLVLMVVSLIAASKITAVLSGR